MERAPVVFGYHDVGLGLFEFFHELRVLGGWRSGYRSRLVDARAQHLPAIETQRHSDQDNGGVRRPECLRQLRCVRKDLAGTVRLNWLPCDVFSDLENFTHPAIVVGLHLDQPLRQRTRRRR